jgi:hypothetical protein
VRTRGVIGKRIAAVEQQPITTPSNDRVYHIIAIVLEDGTRLVPHVAELEADYAVEMTAYKGRR